MYCGQFVRGDAAAKVPQSNLGFGQSEPIQFWLGRIKKNQIDLSWCWLSNFGLSRKFPFREIHDLPCCSNPEKFGFVDERTFCPVVLCGSSKGKFYRLRTVQPWLVRQRGKSFPGLWVPYQNWSRTFLSGVPNFLGKGLLLNFGHPSTLMSNRGQFDRGSANDKIFLLQGSTTQACLGVS